MTVDQNNSSNSVTSFPVRHPVDGQYCYSEAEFAAKNEKYKCKSIPNMMEVICTIREADENAAKKRREDIIASMKETRELYGIIEALERNCALDFSKIPGYVLQRDTTLVGLAKKWSDAVKLETMKRQLEHETEKLSNTKP